MAEDYPAEPWKLHGSMWLSLWWLPQGDGRHDRGVWGTALVDYVEPSPLTYHELLVARSLRPPRPPLPGRPGGPLEVEITDIWVDSDASRRGGLELWAIPKAMGDFTLDGHHWTAPGVRARFADGFPALRLPYGARLVQPPLTGSGDPVTTPFGGTGRIAPCRAQWDLDADGPLAFLRRARRLGSFHVSDFALTFGR